MNYTIRQAIPGDAAVLTEFQLKMALETEDLVLDKNVLEKGILSLLKDASKGIYYVVEYEGEVIGCLLTTPEWSEWRNGTVLWIQSVFIAQDYRGKGVFKALYSSVKNKVIADKALKGIRLYVDSANQNAQEVYRKVGMDGHHYQLFEWLK